KFNKLINSGEEGSKESEELIEDQKPIGSRSSNPNEVFLPIDFNLLIPSNKSSSSNTFSLLNSSSLSLADSSIVDEEDDEHIVHEEMPQYELIQGDSGRMADFEDFDHNSLDFVQQLIKTDRQE